MLQMSYWYLLLLVKIVSLAINVLVIRYPKMYFTLYCCRQSVLGVFEQNVPLQLVDIFVCPAPQVLLFRFMKTQQWKDWLDKNSVF